MVALACRVSLMRAIPTGLPFNLLWREKTRQLVRAKSLALEGRYSEACTLLDDLLQDNEDLFIRPDPQTPEWRGLKTEALRQIGEMPGAGRQVYELEFGARAAQMLDAAAKEGDIAKLEEIARRYFHTQAGYQAMLLLGRHQLDHHHPLAAALCFQRLTESPAAETFEPSLSVLLASSWLESGMPDRAAKVLVALQKKSPNAALRLGGKELRLFSDPNQALAWLQTAVGQAQEGSAEQVDNWTIARGDPAHNANSAGGMPVLNPRWRATMTDYDKTLEKNLQATRDGFIRDGIPALPSMQPLAIGNLILMRAGKETWAVDFETGKQRWPIFFDEQIADRLAGASASGDGTRSDGQNNAALVERFFQDSTFGNLSSDGAQVYMLEGLDIATQPMLSMQQMRGMGFGGRGGNPFGVPNDPQGAAKQCNRLCARELRTQMKLKWQVGGPNGEDEPKLAGASFLGVPLPLDGKLYALVEMRNLEIRLCALDAKTGHLDWSQQIAIVTQGLWQDRIRRLAGCTPAFAGGVLVCPTSAGAIVAVDLASRTLLWGYQYTQDNDPYLITGANQIIFRRGGGGGWGGADIPQPNNPAERWLDSSVIVADGCVVVTPSDSTSLHCLNLVDGKPIFKPRGATRISTWGASTSEMRFWSASIRSAC